MSLSRGNARVRFCLSVVLLALLCLRAAGAFDTFSFWGGDVHGAITRQALSFVAPSSLAYVQLGDRTQDKFYLPRLFFDPRHHFVNDEISRSLAWIQQQRHKVVAEAEQAPQDYAKWRRALFDFGALLHSVQDFYAHSNYVEIRLARHQPMTLPDWSDLPRNLKTCYFQYRSFPPGEVEAPATYHDAFGVKFITPEELARAPDRVALVADTPLAFTHAELNKDNAHTPEGRIRVSPGVTVFDLARALAVQETRRQWNLLCRAVRRNDPGQAPKILAVLQRGWLCDLPPGQGPARPSRQVSAALAVDDRLDTRCSLLLQPGGRDRKSFEAAIHRALFFAHRDLGLDDAVTQGARDLSLTRGASWIRLTYIANPYGFDQRLGRLRVQPDGAVRIALSPATARFERIVVKVPGAILYADGGLGADPEVVFHRVRTPRLTFRPWGTLHPPPWMAELEPPPDDDNVVVTRR